MADYPATPIQQEAKIQRREFICREDNTTLLFSKCPSIDIDYDSSIHFPIASATNLATTLPQMNLCITTKSK